MKTPKSTNLGLLKRGYNIPHTEVKAYLYPAGSLDCLVYRPRKIYDDEDVYYYHGRKDLQNVISTYLGNRVDLGVGPGDIVCVDICQACPDDPYVEEINANFCFVIK